KSRVGTLGGPASSMSTLRPRSAASLATQPPLAPDPMMSTSYGMVCSPGASGAQHQIAGDGAEDTAADGATSSPEAISSIWRWGGRFQQPLWVARRVRRANRRYVRSGHARRDRVSARLSDLGGG